MVIVSDPISFVIQNFIDQVKDMIWYFTLWGLFWFIPMALLCTIYNCYQDIKFIEEWIRNRFWGILKFGNHYWLELVDVKPFEIWREIEICSFFQENGYVVVRGATERKNCENLIKCIKDIAKKVPEATADGFMDLYHDDTLAQLRQDPEMYKLFTKLLGTEKLWVVFDRVIYQPEQVSSFSSVVIQHMDQNPNLYSDFCAIQAMIALKDINEETGVLTLIPKSSNLPMSLGLCVKEGDLIIWDSRTTHSRLRSNCIGKEQFAALISFTKSQCENSELKSLRMKYFIEGTGFNHHDAGLRTTSQPRFSESLRKTTEKLTSLGKKLYGIQDW